MPASFADEGLVLRRRTFGDADRILVVLTREHGKLSVLARGVRRAKARNGAGLDLLARSQMMLIPGRNMAVLAEAAVRNHMLKNKGIDPAQTFIDRQAHQMQRLPPW